MGGAIAKGLANSGEILPEDIMVCSPNNKYELDILKDKFKKISVSKDNTDATKCGAEFIFIAVKPWLFSSVLDEIMPHFNAEKQTIVSIVAGASFSDIKEMMGELNVNPKIIRLIPNTAISIGESMTFIANNEESKEEANYIARLFNYMGKSMIVTEHMMAAGTSLASCGIAFAMRYIRAASEGGVELGFYADSAKEIVMQTLLGAVKLLDHTKNNPEVEIDKVTTPGGITIKGLNAMERNGFTNAVIEGLKASHK